MDLEGFLEAAGELLAVESTADRPDQLRRAVEHVVDYVGPGFTVERFGSNGKPSALLYASRYSQRPAFRLILNAHLDVVPAGPEQFRPRLEDGRLYARGAQDMKVSALVQAHVFREQANTLDYPLALQLVADEEVGGLDGTLHQLERGVTGEFVVIGEQSGLDIVTDSKGLLHVRLKATGRSAHGAYPWLGDNALVKLMNAVNRLLERYPEPGEEVWRTTVNVARIETPNRTYNQIPDEAEAWLDIRFPAEDSDILERLRKEEGVTVEVDEFDPPQHTDPDRPEVQLLQRVARLHQYQGKMVWKHGGSDAGFFSARGIAAVAFGIGGGGQHGPGEHAVVATIGPYYRALTDFLQSLEPAA